MIDWAQTLTILGGVAAMWFGCFTILRDDIKGMENRHREDMKAMKEEMKEIHSHWREMFTYMNNKIDEVKKPS